MLTYDEIADHVEDLVGLLAEDVPPLRGEDPVRHAGTPYTGNVRVGEAPPGTSARADWVAAVELDDDVLVLRHGRAFRLENLMATVWLELDEPRTTEELAAAAPAVHGPHPDAVSLVDQALDLLVQEGLVVRGPGD